MSRRVRTAMRPSLVPIALSCTVLAVFGASGARAESCERLIASGNPEYAPYLWRDARDPSRLVGANAALMEKLSAEIGVPIEMRYIGSWARVQEEMKSGHVDLIAGAFFTLDRLDYMDYAYPSMAVTRSVVLTAAGSPIDYRQWSDLVGHQGVTVINNSFGETFDRYAEDNLSIEEVGKLENALKMVANARADYLIYEDAPAHAFAAKLGIETLHEGSQSISNEELYLTISHDSSCNTGALRGKIGRAMHKFAAEKTMEGLIAKAIEEWQSP
ncbi:substrate-binding periplasmic protein [Dongia sp.]|uniref:substrate-binding periplasmic protein n=1 Tax=Dongia sp. TaxID=1977262 RepID=UPI0035AFC0EC